MESALTISPPIRSASSRANADFPEAVGPWTMTRLVFSSSLTPSLLPFEPPLHLGEGEPLKDRAAVGAVGGVVGGVHLGKQGLDLGGGEGVLSPHHAVAGNAGKDLLYGVGNGTVRSDRLELLQSVPQDAEVVLPGQKPRHTFHH